MDPVTMFWSVLLRSGQALADASAMILCGLITAGVMRSMFGSQGVRRIFGSRGWRGHLRAWVMGMLLPVCSVGVIPVARELIRSGVSGGTVLAFVLAAPLLNPISFLYGLTLAEPFVIVCFAGASLLLALVMGEIWEYVFPSAPMDTTVVDNETMPAYGLKRMFAVILSSAREAVGPTMFYCLIALLGTSLLSLAIPFGSLQTSMSHYKAPWSSPPLMACIAIPSYSTPLNGMMKIGLMFEHGNSIGAAFVLFVLGIGTNIGLIVWVMREFGWRTALLWFGTMTVAAILLGYLSENTLYREGIHEADHTHAFDDFSAPFPISESVTYDHVKPKLQEKFQGIELLALGTIAALMVLGWIDRRFLQPRNIDAYLCRQPVVPEDQDVPIWNRPIPGPVIGVLILIGLIVFSVVGAYLYYPNKADTLSAMQRTQADVFAAVRSTYREEAIRQLELWDLWTRKLQVGVYIREFKVDPDAMQAAEELRERIEMVRDALLRNEKDEAAEPLSYMANFAYRRCRKAFDPQDSVQEGNPVDVKQHFAEMDQLIDELKKSLTQPEANTLLKKWDAISRKAQLDYYRQTVITSEEQYELGRNFRLQLKELSSAWSKQPEPELQTLLQKTLEKYEPFRTEYLK